MDNENEQSVNNSVVILLLLPADAADVLKFYFRQLTAAFTKSVVIRESNGSIQK